MTSVKHVASYSKLFFFFFFFFFFFCKFLSCLVCVQSFKSINSSSLSRKKYDGINFTPTISQQLHSQNASLVIGLIGITEPSDTLNYKPFFKHCTLQTILQVFYCLYLCGTKSFSLKTELYFTFSRFGLGWHSVLQY